MKLHRRWLQAKGNFRIAHPRFWRRLIGVREALRRGLYSLLRIVFLGDPRVTPPRHAFRLLDLVRAGRVPGRVVVESQPLPRLTPHSLRTISPLGQLGHQPWPIFWATLRHVRLVGPEMAPLDARGRFAAEATGFPFFSPPLLPNYLFLPPAERLAGDWMTIINRWWSANYYHWLVDELPLLALLPELPAATRILCPMCTPYQKESLRMLGLLERCVFTGHRHFIVECFHFCAPSTWTGFYDPYAIKFLRDSFLPHADPDYPALRRIFIRRRQASREITNEDELVAALVARGWVALAAEELTFAQQIKAFSAAEFVCGLHGAGLTNLAWCPPGCKVLEIVQDHYLNGSYENIAEANRLDYRYHIVPGDAFNRSLVSVEEILSVLEHWPPAEAALPHSS